MTSMEKDLKHGLEEVLYALSRSFDEDAERKYGSLVKEIREEYSHLDIKTPEECSMVLSFTFDEVAETFVKLILSSVDLDSLKKEKLEFVYRHYQFIELHLENVLTKHEGLFASSDKSGWLINAYVQYLHTDKLPIIEERSYWHPKKGEVKEWMDWIDSMYDMFYGKPEKYMLIMLLVLKHYQEDKKEGGEKE
jgi:hypothetical protein